MTNEWITNGLIIKIKEYNNNNNNNAMHNNNNINEWQIALSKKLTPEEMMSKQGIYWRVVQGSWEFKDWIIRESSEMQSLEIGRLNPGDMCRQ